jgi:hypothetical protein
MIINNLTLSKPLIIECFSSLSRIRIFNNLLFERLDLLKHMIFIKILLYLLSEWLAIRTATYPFIIINLWLNSLCACLRGR